MNVTAVFLVFLFLYSSIPFTNCVFIGTCKKLMWFWSFSFFFFCQEKYFLDVLCTFVFLILEAYGVGLPYCIIFINVWSVNWVHVTIILINFYPLIFVLHDSYLDPLLQEALKWFWVSIITSQTTVPVAQTTTVITAVVHAVSLGRFTWGAQNKFPGWMSLSAKDFWYKVKSRWDYPWAILTS